MIVAAELFTFRSSSLYRCIDQDVKVWVVVFFFPALRCLPASIYFSFPGLARIVLCEALKNVFRT